MLVRCFDAYIRFVHDVIHGQVSRCTWWHVQLRLLVLHGVRCIVVDIRTHHWPSGEQTSDLVRIAQSLANIITLSARLGSYT